MAESVFSRRLRELRKERRMSQQEIAAALRIHRTTYTKYETGVVTPDQQGLVQLAEMFGVTVDYLLGRTHTAVPDDLEESAGELVSLSLQEKLLVQMYRQLSYAEQQELQQQIQTAFNRQRRQKQQNE